VLYAELKLIEVPVVPESRLMLPITLLSVSAVGAVEDSPLSQYLILNADIPVPDESAVLFYSVNEDTPDPALIFTHLSAVTVTPDNPLSVTVYAPP
jgi:hypothetical protein